MAVFAQWTDKCYYAARVTQADGATAGKWRVQFEDSRTRVLPEEFVLPIKVLPKRQSVLVLNEDYREGRPAVVVGYHNDAAQVSFVCRLGIEYRLDDCE